MGRVILYASTATLAFIVGVAANWSMNTLGGFAVDSIYQDADVDMKISTILPDEGYIRLPAHHCGLLVVSVTADGALNLNTMPMGTMNDSNALIANLRTILEKREALHTSVDSLGPLRASEDRYGERTVYIKAPRSMSYGEVADLIAALKEAGANPIGLIADRPGPQP